MRPRLISGLPQEKRRHRHQQAHTESPAMGEERTRRRRLRRHRGAVPEVLRRLFHNRARTLADTITSLSPLSDGGWSYSNSDFLLRPGDPRDYLNLLTRCFVVVSGNAPSLAKAFSYCPPGVWSQHQIVTRTIEFMLCEQSPSSNVLCSNYDKGQQLCDSHHMTYVE